MMPAEEAAQLVYDALAAAVDQDARRTLELVTQLGEDSDSVRMLGVCYSVAEAGHTALKKLFGDEAPNPVHGDMWVLKQLVPHALDDDPVKGFAARFLLAYCNGDRETACALYGAALTAGPETFVDGVCWLLADVGGLCRSATEPAEVQAG